MYCKINEGSADLHKQFVGLKAFKCPLGLHSCTHKLIINACLTFKNSTIVITAYIYNDKVHNDVWGIKYTLNISLNVLIQT